MLKKMSEMLRVKCDVTECVHNVNGYNCALSEINVTEQTLDTYLNAVETPHYCGNFQKK